MSKQTPLYERHLALGANMVDFAGTSLPIFYPSGIVQEHLAVRQRVGIFDVSHMGEIRIQGAGSAAFLDFVCTNTMQDLPENKARYTLLCNEQGGIIDDVLVYHLGKDTYWMVVNACNIAKDVAWLTTHAPQEVDIVDESETIAQVAIQGVSATQVLETILPDLPQTYYSFAVMSYWGEEVLVSKSGYTGDEGYEVYGSASAIQRLWDACIQANITPCGLGARDTLRLEAGMPLYGHELSDTILATETRLSFALKMTHEFIGKQALQQSKPAKRSIGLLLCGKAIAREHTPVYQAGKQVGVVTSGTYSPSLQTSIANALVEVDTVDDHFEVEIRGKRWEALVAQMPYYSNKRKGEQGNGKMVQQNA
ncbi:MAG: glycine cleavage system aminomethyltransferase GcvT [Erysipelotrichaceae bacterium]